MLILKVDYRVGVLAKKNLILHFSVLFIIFSVTISLNKICFRPIFKQN